MDKNRIGALSYKSLIKIFNLTKSSHGVFYNKPQSFWTLISYQNLFASGEIDFSINKNALEIWTLCFLNFKIKRIKEQWTKDKQQG